MSRAPYTEATWATAADVPAMLWAVSEAALPRAVLAAAACACARLVLPRVPTHEDRPRRAIEVAEAWVRGAATEAEAQAAALTAYELARHAHGSLRAAALAASAARTSTAAHHAATAVARSVDDAVASSRLFLPAHHEAARRMADLVRARVPWATLADAHTRPRAATR